MEEGKTIQWQKDETTTKNGPQNTTQKTSKLPIRCTETHESPWVNACPPGRVSSKQFLLH
jgi:hypothetical protein